ncbi:hypothetical protein N0V82_004320 [Gnomoniopsis sp. IMI 355080]|nr:hypothetical protein N0V82_004320 [Gnomoniopsis sp. IMI 355080]
MHMLRRRKGQYNGSEFEKWFEIWDLLFPDRPRPKSPFGLSDLDTRDGICGWGLRVMDDLQRYVERRVSITVLDKLEKNYTINTDELEEQKKIKSLITESVGSAFEEYKDHVDPQYERITELHEEPEPISEPLDGFKREDAAVTKPTTSQASTLSPSNSTISTSLSEQTEYMTLSMYLPLLSDSWTMSKSPEHIGLTSLPAPAILERPGLMGADVVQDYPSVLEATDYPYDNSQFWPVDHECYGHQFRDESQNATDGGSVAFDTAEFQL